MDFRAFANKLSAPAGPIRHLTLAIVIVPGLLSASALAVDIDSQRRSGEQGGDDHDRQRQVTDWTCGCAELISECAEIHRCLLQINGETVAPAIAFRGCSTARRITWGQQRTRTGRYTVRSRIDEYNWHCRKRWKIRCLNAVIRFRHSDRRSSSNVPIDSHSRLLRVDL